MWYTIYIIRSYANYNKNGNVTNSPRTIVKEEMKMADELLVISDGTFTLSETERENQFYFYRNDGEVLTGIDQEPMLFYRTYIFNKMIEGKLTDIVMQTIYSEMSDDGKCIRLTISDIGKKSELGASNQKPNIFKRLLNKIWE